MRSMLPITAVAFTLVSGAALAANWESRPVQQANAVDNEKIICAPVTHEGMLIRRVRECHTMDGWARIRLRNQQRIREIQMKNLTANN